MPKNFTTQKEYIAAKSSSKPQLYKKIRRTKFGKIAAFAPGVSKQLQWHKVSEN